MGTYFIKDLESITGIKAHTIRIWEQRYHLVAPKRTATNIRYYDDEDVKLLLNIALLNNKGLKISKIAGLSKTEIQNEAMMSCKKCNEYDDLINSLILATYNLNEDAFNKVFSNFIFQEGFENTIEKLAFPFLQRLGDLWVSNAMHPALEHFATNIIKKKIHIAIEGQTEKREDSKKFILFLPPGEMHELGLLYTNFLVKKHGHEAFYMGQNTPHQHLHEVIPNFKADYLVSAFIGCKATIDPAKFVNEIHADWPGIKMLLSGFYLLNDREKFMGLVHNKDNVSILTHPQDILQFLQ